MNLEYEWSESAKAEGPSGSVKAGAARAAWVKKGENN